MITIIDDDEIMAECVQRAVLAAGFNRGVKVFRDGVSAMEMISRGELPELIFLDILLDGVDGWTFLNEMVSYIDTAAIPVVIISSLSFSGFLEEDLREYGVIGVLEKEKMTPEDIKRYVWQIGI